ncbi:hypothetical protein GCM10011579_034540 [Streptomyces albiflavescens]|uniref:Uncharacterized protein n=1 Tax=Streptomyces albiflavescens TaxID=1623582 RepID=A0A917Y4H8_9ACTN|nr:hypothetical protein GCM10011579_034540 [Streptomyces albiflavescens]
MHLPIMGTDPDGGHSVTPAQTLALVDGLPPSRAAPRFVADPAPCLRCCLFCPQGTETFRSHRHFRTSGVLSNGPTRTG